jgi:predicted kinase
LKRGMNMFFLQMSGFPGSGKSTLAREIAAQTGAVLVDHDVVKSALLEEMPEINPQQAGKVAYNIDWSLVDSNLALGNSAILDSPCLYPVMIEKGEALAEKYGTKYKYIECYLDDYEQINHRLKNRETMRSHIREVSSEVVFRSTLENSKRPLNHPFLIVDTSKPLEGYLQKAMDYINS